MRCKKRAIWKRMSSAMLAFITMVTVVSPGMVMPVQASSEAAEEIIAYYDFENETAGSVIITDKEGSNNGSLEGNAQVAYDDEKKSYVLELPGGDGNYAALQQGMLNGCKNLIISMDIKVSGNEFVFAFTDADTDANADGNPGANYMFMQNASWSAKSTINSGYGEEGTSYPALDSGWNKVEVDLNCGNKTMTVYVNDNPVPAGVSSIESQLSAMGDDLYVYLGKHLWNNSGIACSYDNVKISTYDTLEGIKVTTKPTKTAYGIGEELDLDGMVVEATYDDADSTSKGVTDYKVSGFNSSKVGEQTITVSYTEHDVTQTDEFTVIVDEDRIIAYYDFEGETKGSAVITDKTGNGYAGELSGNSQIEFDASKDSNVLKLSEGDGNYAELPRGMLAGCKNLIISMDIKVSGYGFLFGFAESSAAGNPGGEYMFVEANTAYLKSTIRSAQAEEWETSVVAWPDLTDWCKLKVDLNSGNGTMKAYIDGELIGTQNIQSKLSEMGDDLFVYLGKHLWVSTGINCSYDNVKISTYDTLESIEVTTPEKTEYEIKEEFVAEGMAVTAVYSDGSEKKVTDYTVSGFDSTTAGAKTITVSYTEDEVTKTAEFTVNVKEAESVVVLESIKVATPGKTEYEIDETFDSEGMAVTAVYSDGSEKEINDYTVSGFDSTTAGSKTITVTYTEDEVTKIAEFTVIVKEKDIETEPFTVTFLDCYGKVLKEYTNIDSFSAGMVPELEVAGYEFAGWKLEGNYDIFVDWTTISADATYLPVYTVTEYSVDVKGGTITVTATGITGATSGSYPLGTALTVKAEITDGFSYWQTTDGTIVSYNSTYIFTVPNTDISIEAVYDAEEVKPVALYAAHSGSTTSSATFTVMLDNVDSSKIKYFGLIATSDSVFAESDDFIYGNPNVEYTKYSTAYRYTWTKSLSNNKYDWYIKAYCLYEVDTKEESDTTVGGKYYKIYYSDVVEGSILN